MAANSEIAVLDACVLYPAPLRDLLLSLAADGLYQARWTQMIQTEWINSLLANRPDLQPPSLFRTADLMNQAIDGSMVVGFEHLIQTLTLPDPNDRHVLAAAITCGASSIITFNTKDFAQQSHISILHPDDFCTSLYIEKPETALLAIRTLRRRLRTPKKTAEELIATYERLGLRKLSAMLVSEINAI